MHVRPFGTGERLTSKAHLPSKSVALFTQIDEVFVPTEYLALLVGQVFRGFRVSVAVHLRYGMDQLGLRRTQ